MRCTNFRVTQHVIPILYWTTTSWPMVGEGVSSEASEQPQVRVPDVPILFTSYSCLPCTVSVRYRIQINTKITLFNIDSDRRKIRIGFVKMQNKNTNKIQSIVWKQTASLHSKKWNTQPNLTIIGWWWIFKNIFKTIIVYLEMTVQNYFNNKIIFRPALSLHIYYCVHQRTLGRLLNLIVTN